MKPRCKHPEFRETFGACPAIPECPGCATYRAARLEAVAHRRGRIAAGVLLVCAIAIAFLVPWLAFR